MLQNKFLRPVAAVVLIGCLIIQTSCSTVQYREVKKETSTSISKVFKDEPIEAGVALTTAQTLQHAIKDDAQREAVADYVNVYASAFRSFTDAPTPDKVASELTKWIPKSAVEKHPEIYSLGIQLAAKQYAKYYPKLIKNKNVQKTISIMNKIATGLEYGTNGLTSNATLEPSPVPKPVVPITATPNIPITNPQLAEDKKWWQIWK